MHFLKNVLYMCTSYQIIAQYHKTDFYISTSAKREIYNQGIVHEKNKNSFTITISKATSQDSSLSECILYKILQTYRLFLSYPIVQFTL